MYIGIRRRERGRFFFSRRGRHTRCSRDWSSDVCSSDLEDGAVAVAVVGNTHAATALDDSPRQQFRRRRSASEVDVAAVRRAANTFRIEAKLREERRRNRSEERRGGKEFR